MKKNSKSFQDFVKKNWKFCITLPVFSVLFTTGYTVWVMLEVYIVESTEKILKFSLFSEIIYISFTLWFFGWLIFNWKKLLNISKKYISFTHKSLWVNGYFLHTSRKRYVRTKRHCLDIAKALYRRLKNLQLLRR